MSTCPACGAVSPQGVRYCVRCGAPMPRRCPECALDNPPDAAFCGQCGRALPGPAAAAARSAGSPAQPAAERRQLTVLFCDLADYTPLSQRLDPEDLRDLLQAHVESCARVIERFAGHVAQRVGDALLAYFGYPRAQEDAPYRAVRAGLGIIDAVASLNPRVRQRYGAALHVRVGVHTGLVVVGEMGAGATHEATAIIGETTNVAARLQALAEPDTLVTGAATYRLIQGLFDCRSLGPRPLKGIAQPVEVYQVMRESGARTRLEATASGDLTPLVGRKQELHLLQDCWEQAKDGVGKVVLLGGEPGIGKSRLVRALSEHVAADPRAWLTPCQCSPYHQSTPLFPIIDLLQRVVLEFRPSDTVPEKLSKLQGFLAQYGFMLPDVVSLFASLLSLPTGDDDRVSGSPEQRKAQTLQVLVTILLNRAAQQPLLFVVEDLHWIDPSTLELLTLLVDQGPATGMLAVLTFRPTFTPPWSGRSHVLSVTPQRVTRQQAAEIAGRVAHGKPLPPEVLDQVVTKADGVPLFIEELTKTVLESGLLREGADRYELPHPLPPLAIPASLQDSLMARLDRLAPVKAVAQLGAMLGREFSFALLQGVSGVDEDTLQRHLAQLVAAELLYVRGMPPQAAYVFKHALIQEAAYNSLLRSRREQLHQRTARVLEERFPEVVETQPELLARHYTAAGLAEEAIAYWQRAGERAAARSANVEAISHFTAALTLLATLPDTPERARRELTLQIVLGVPLIAVRGYAAPETVRATRRARELAEQTGASAEPLPLLYREWLVQASRSQQRPARDAAERFLALAERQGESGPILIGHRVLGASLLFCGEQEAAQAHLERAVALYDPRAHRALISWLGSDPLLSTLCWWSLNLWLRGFVDQALRRVNEAVASGRELGHANTTAYARIYGGVVIEQLRRNPEGVQEHVDATLALASKHQLTMWLAFATVAGGWAAVARGRSEEGVSQMLRGLGDVRSTGQEVLRPFFLGWLAEGHARSGQIDEGLRVLGEALTGLESSGERWCEAELHRLRGELLLMGGASAAEAEACFRLALDISRRQQAVSFELRALVSLTRLMHGQRRDLDARPLLVETLNRFTEGFDTPDLHDARALV